jgi:hypothetical protein
MSRTNNIKTYEDLLLRKRILKQEIKEMEETLSIENLPKVFGKVGKNLKNKAAELIQDPVTLNLLIGWGAEKFISRFIKKKSMCGKIALAVSSYLIPLAISKAKDTIVRIANKG